MTLTKMDMSSSIRKIRNRLFEDWYFLLKNYYYFQTLQDKRKLCNKDSPKDKEPKNEDADWPLKKMNGRKLGLYREQYKVTAVGKWLSKLSILYDLKELKPEFDTELQLRTIKFQEFSSFTNAIYCYIMYQHQISNYTCGQGVG